MYGMCCESWVWPDADVVPADRLHFNLTPLEGVEVSWNRTPKVTMKTTLNQSGLVCR